MPSGVEKGKKDERVAPRGRLRASYVNDRHAFVPCFKAGMPQTRRELLRYQDSILLLVVGYAVDELPSICSRAFSFRAPGSDFHQQRA